MSDIIKAIIVGACMVQVCVFSVKDLYAQGTRTWENNKGKTLRASFVDLIVKEKNGKQIEYVVLERTSDHKQFEIPLKTLSGFHQSVAKKYLKLRKKKEEIAAREKREDIEGQVPIEDVGAPAPTPEPKPVQKKGPLTPSEELALIGALVERGQLKGGQQDMVFPGVVSDELTYTVAEVSNTTEDDWHFQLVVEIKYKTKVAGLTSSAIYIRPQDIPKFKSNLKEMLETAHKIRDRNLFDVEKTFDFIGPRCVRTISKAMVSRYSKEENLSIVLSFVSHPFPMRCGSGGVPSDWFPLATAEQMLSELDIKTVEAFKKFIQMQDL